VEALSQREGKRVYVEVGTTDPEGNGNDDAIVLRSWMILGAVEPAHDTDRDRMVVMVRLPQLGSDSSCIYFDPARITRILAHGQTYKVTFHNSFYASFSGGIDVGDSDDG
jgi:hypothetical protein